MIGTTFGCRGLNNFSQKTFGTFVRGVWLNVTLGEMSAKTKCPLRHKVIL